MRDRGGDLRLASFGACRAACVVDVARPRAGGPRACRREPCSSRSVRPRAAGTSGSRPGTRDGGCCRPGPATACRAPTFFARSQRGSASPSSRPRERDAAIELDDRVLRVLAAEPLHRRRCCRAASAERGADLGGGRRRQRLAERRLALLRLRLLGRLRVASVTPTTDPGGDDGHDGDDEDDLDGAATMLRKVAGMPIGATIVCIAMLSYRELLKKTQGRDQPRSTPPRRAISTGALFVDVREREEWDEGHIPGAVHVPRGNLESRIEGVAPDRDKPARPLLRLRRALGVRREDARRARLRATSSRSPAASPTGSATATRSCCRARSRPRSARATPATSLIPEIGEEGQLKLLDSKILILGAGGLGSPASLYLAAAGVGHLGIIDADIVDESNLQRQIAHSLNTLGSPKVDSAKRAIEALNPDVEVTTYRERLTLREHRADPRRRLGDDRRRHRQLPDALPRERRVGLAQHPGRARLDLPLRGPGHRVQAERRARATAASTPPRRRRSSRRRAPEGGVLGVLPGIVGTLQTNEALKLALGIGDPLIGRLLLFDALATEFTEVRIKQEPGLPRLRRAPDDHRLHRLRRVLHAVSVVQSVPPVLREEAGGAREVEATGATVRELLEDLSDAAAGARRDGLRRRRDPAVRERLRRRRGRADARRPGRTRPRGRDGRPPARHGGREWPLAPRAGIVASSLLDLIGNTPLVELQHLSPAGRPHLRQARGPEPDRLDQGPDRARDGRRGRPRSRARSCSSRRAATRASRSRSSRSCAGYKLTCVMPANATPERRLLLELYGATIIDSPGERGLERRGAARAGDRGRRTTAT